MFDDDNKNDDQHIWITTSIRWYSHIFTWNSQPIKTVIGILLDGWETRFVAPNGPHGS